MTGPRLVRLMPTGEMVDTPGGLVQCMEPTEVEPLSEERLRDLCDSVPDYDISTHDLIKFARAIEAEHGIGRRLDA